MQKQESNTAGTSPATVLDTIPKTCRAALYARRIFADLVQPDEEDPTALQQIGSMKSYLKDLPDVTVSGVYMDSQNLTYGQPRPQFQKLLLDIRNGKYDCIVMYSMDRFGKDAAENQYYVLRQFTVLGLRIISVLDEYDSSISEADSGSFLRLEDVIRQNMAFDRSRKRTASMRKLNQNGQFMVRNKIPYGYLYCPEAASKMAIDTETAPYVRLIFEKYTSEGKSTTQIAKHLTEISAPSPSMRSAQLGSRSGKMPPNDYWSSGGVLGILKNRMYTGDYSYGKETYAIYINRDHSNRHREGAEQIIPDHHEPIISHEVYELAQKRIEASRKPVKRFRETPEYSSHPFRKHMFCGQCGRVAYTRYSERNATAYICSSHVNKLEGACHYPPIRLADILPDIRAAVLAEHTLARNLHEQMKDGTKSRLHERIETCFQARIDRLVEAGKQINDRLSTLTGSDPEERNTLLETENRNRRELEKALREKAIFHRQFRVTNIWLRLYSQMDENFDFTPDFVRKYIYRIELFPDAPPKMQPMKQEAKEKLLPYLWLLDGYHAAQYERTGDLQWQEQADGTDSCSRPADL